MIVRPTASKRHPSASGLSGTSGSSTNASSCARFANTAGSTCSSAPRAINQIIDYIHPEGTIAIMGVSEDPVPVNTRMVLEKGLRIFGSSRSGNRDFQNLVDFYVAHPEVVREFKKIIGDVVAVNTIEDMNKAFDLDRKRHGGKTVIVWEK